MSRSTREQREKQEPPERVITAHNCVEAFTHAIKSIAGELSPKPRTGLAHVAARHLDVPAKPAGLFMAVAVAGEHGVVNFHSDN
jgi:hypothetical protein